jgi:succinoglycan biosynthesis transport protein ExoP
MSSSTASISIAIVSKGRPEILAATLEGLTRQTRKPEKIVIVVPSTSDLPAELVGDVQTVVGPLGASLQRNEATRVIPLSVGYVAFIDDDMEFAPNYLDCAVAFLEANPGVVAFSGHVLGNGNVTRDHARQLIADYQPVRNFRGMFQSTGSGHSLHGCNMVIRRAVLEYEQFDEELPLYSYNEDYDLSMRLEAYGRIGRFLGCIAVHLETPSGRVREDQRGYSLVANNYYFITRKTVHLPLPLAWIRFWIVCVGSPLLSCLSHMARQDHSLDYRGRMKGILLAVKDIFMGRSHPGRIKEF